MTQYTPLTAKAPQRWVLYHYVAGRFTPLSKPFKTKEEAEQARLKYTEREQKRIGVGFVRP